VDYLIELQHETDIAGVDTHALERVAAHALAVEHVARPSEVSLLIADDMTVRELNRQYRATDAPTDVLSFSQTEGEEFALPEDASPHLGDVIISLDTARRQAAEASVPLQSELEHLVVHGILHLLGYDHEEPDDAERMRLHEDAILGAAVHPR
jgi:probable rRNA maturation factor